jgi:DNA primase
MNSSDTPLFHKGGMLYGEPRARQAALDGQSLIVVEGYVDVIACSKAGYDGAMAPMGTALTEEQIMVLWQMIPQDSKVPVLCFDGDAAGRRAAARACDKLLPMLKAHHSARFAFLPDGQDPDSLVNSAGPKALEGVIEAAMPLVEFLWVYHTAGQKFDTPEARAGLSKTLEQETLKIPDREVQHYYKQAFREKINKAFAQNYAQSYPQKRGGYSKNENYGKPSQNQGVVSIKRPRFTGEANKLIAAAINHPAIFDVFEEEIGLLNVQEPRVDALRQSYIAILNENNAIERDDLIVELRKTGFESELRALLSDNLYALARFARPQAEYEEVCEGWREKYHTMQKRFEINENQKNMAERAE